MKSTVIVFPGSNCDRDIEVALRKLQTKYLLINLKNYLILATIQKKLI